MDTNQLNFTKRTLTSLPSPANNKRVYYYDTKARGLVLSITVKGTKSFQVYRKVNGRPERITLGRFPDLSIEQARGLANEVNSQLTRGINPNDIKRKERREKNLDALFSYYLNNHAKIHKKSWRDDEKQFNRYLKNWKNKKLSQIYKQDIQKLHSSIGEQNGHYAANRLLALLHTLFSHGINWGFCKENPAHGIKKFKEKSRERFLQADELPRFFEALSQDENSLVRDYLLISLLTGARKSNVLAMRWDEINVDNATWTIPDTKNGSAHTVPLVSIALEVLQNRRRNNPAPSPWVFPANSKSGHLMEPKKVWARILKRAGIEDLRLHDLRRSLGSWQAATGASLSIIGKSLAHKNVSTTAIYARLNIDPVREAMNKATTAMLEAGNIIKLSDSNNPTKLSKNT